MKGQSNLGMAHTGQPAVGAHANVTRETLNN